MHHFESGFFTRVPAWHGLGRVVEDVPTIEEGLKLAGLDWIVDKEPAYDKRGNIVADLFLTTRRTDNKVLGNVGRFYKIVQPAEAMDFLNAILGKDLILDTAGSLYGGRVIWALSKAPEVDILGDKIQPYVFVKTSYDSSCPTKAGTTATRVVCSNTLDLADKDCARSFSVRHSTNLKDKIAEAARVMKVNNDYIDALRSKAEVYATTKVSAMDFTRLTNELFGEPDLMTKRQLNDTDKLKTQFAIALSRPDLENFKGSAWHVFNAVGDFATHIEPNKKTQGWQDRLWDSFMDGNTWLQKTEAILDELVAA
jgi:phage/plasmid-like protein (TIGR03299 family)